MTIPPEIVDRIIDYVHDDPETLIACSLVARDWAPSTRLHLFAKMDILTAREGTRLKELASILPKLLCYCQELTLGVTYGLDNTPATPGYIQLNGRVNGFTSLHTLHIRGFPSRPEDKDFVELLLAISEKITTLTLSESGNFESRRDLWKIIRLFPNLQNVHVSNLGYTSSGEGKLVPSRCYSPHIVSFSLSTHCMGFVLEQLAEPPYPLTHLESLEIHHTDQQQKYLNSVATKYQNAITTLKFGAQSTIGDDIPPHIGTYNCLQTLTLGKLELFAAYPSGHKPTTIVLSFAWVAATLEQINSSLRHLVFEIAVTERRDLDAVSWEDVDAFLDSREQFQDLQSVHVVFLDTIPTTLTSEPERLRQGINLSEELMERMWRTVDRGLLRCTARGLRT
ncbi:hypothetical protein BJ322DRAFT_806597 [Thelephora terrestris]|uniref:F-box domain-containing protein n=1 Tax=Thelephora terrestris TaxID=56493 RepID=A0A9P6L6Q5_9AGAM|nr:hypothetical protein BJ322DRAFT_806597 [Thelephora terrestris]